MRIGSRAYAVVDWKTAIEDFVNNKRNDSAIRLNNFLLVRGSYQTGCKGAIESCDAITAEQMIVGYGEGRPFLASANDHMLIEMGLRGLLRGNIRRVTISFGQKWGYTGPTHMILLRGDDPRELYLRHDGKAQRIR